MNMWEGWERGLKSSVFALTTCMLNAGTGMGRGHDAGDWGHRLCVIGSGGKPEELVLGRGPITFLGGDHQQDFA